MIRNLKASGLALLAVFALSAVAASGASASVDLFTSNSANGKTDLTGASVAGTNPTLHVDGADIICEKGTYAGTAASNSETEITIHPVYEGTCTAAGETFTYDTDGCDYVLTGMTHKREAGQTVNGTHATMSIECTPGKEITMTVPSLGITFHFPPQGELLGVTYSNKNTAENAAGTETLTIKITISGIAHTCTGAFCFLLENEGTSSEATYTDDVMVTGYEDSGHFTQNATTHVWSGTHGPQKHISVSPQA